MIEFSVPLIPPSANHYVKHTRTGRHYVTSEAKAFKEAVALCGRGRSMRATAYSVAIAIFLGKGQKGDLDNFAKCCLDAIVDAGIIDTDAKVNSLALSKTRRVQDPHTEIRIW
jgi:crossover junction endodeoxyribonuclease RusA